MAKVFRKCGKFNAVAAEMSKRRFRVLNFEFTFLFEYFTLLINVLFALCYDLNMDL